MSVSHRYQEILSLLLKRKTMINGPISIDRPNKMSKLLNNPYNNYKCIHVAGTNGNYFIEISFLCIK